MISFINKYRRALKWHAYIFNSKICFSLSFLLSCFIVHSESLKEGDLLFQLGAGESDFSDAISDATALPDSLDFVHVAIFFHNSDGSPSVIEASPQNGVSIVSLDSFILDSPIINGKPGIVVKRLIIDFPVNSTISNALSHLGETYDWHFLPDNGKMYCSELIYESYLDENGEHIFSTVPMNFRAPDGSMPEFWIKLYNKLGTEIPQGIPGTNPNDLSRSPLLLSIPFENFY